MTTTKTECETCQGFGSEKYKADGVELIKACPDCCGIGYTDTEATKLRYAVRFMVLDTVSGQPHRVPPSHNSVVSREEAETYFASALDVWRDRLVVVKLACLVPGGDE